MSLPVVEFDEGAAVKAVEENGFEFVDEGVAGVCARALVVESFEGHGVELVEEIGFADSGGLDGCRDA